MKVTILMATRNQAQYIERAIASAIMQKTDFDFELFITNDASTDNTADILVKYNHRKIGNCFIKAVNQKENLKTVRTTLNMYLQSDSEYIAILDSDDEWISDTKLAKQVDKLDSNPGISICCHNTVRNEIDKGDIGPMGTAVSSILTVNDIIAINRVSNSSVMYRRLYSNFPEAMYNLRVGDYPLHLFHAIYGDIYYDSEVQGRYFANPSGMSAQGHGCADDLKQISKFFTDYCVSKNLSYRMER